MKELTLKLWSYQKFAAFSLPLPTDLRFQEFIGRFSQTVPEPKNLASPPLDRTHAIKKETQFHNVECFAVNLVKEVCVLRY